ncbi:MAG: arabinogalactan endo,4-beta-galactosidase [Polyangiaceae bacterium]|jgi:hypothetical protein|nr:arabinogalactan endo,4-beta-galactosidase [Polyangiaceae bacterium]
MIRKKTGLKELTLVVLCGAALVSVACGDDDATGGDGTSGSAGTSTAGSKSTGGSAGSKSTGGSAGTGTGGTSSAGTGNGGTSAAGTSGGGTGGSAGSSVGGEPSGGVPSDGGMAGEGGAPIIGGADAGGAGGEGGEPPVVVLDVLSNLGFEQNPNPQLSNPPDGDTAVFPAWTNTSTPAGKSVIKWQDAHGGSVKLGQWSDAPYTARVEQVVSPIANGTYSFSVWVMRGTVAQVPESYLYAVGYNAADAEEDVTAPTDAAIGGAWVKVTLANIPVTSGSLTVGMYTDANAQGWVNFDDASLERLPD